MRANSNDAAPDVVATPELAAPVQAQSAALDIEAARRDYPAGPAPAHLIRPPPPPEPEPLPRDLYHPMPRSVHELFEKENVFLEAELPGKRGSFDNDLIAGYRGYYQTKDGKLRRIEYINGEVTRVLSIENLQGKFDQYKSANADFKIFNFGEDRYSIIFELPGKTLYLKFFTGQRVPGHEQPIRVMRGWLLDANHRPMPTAVTELAVPELEDVKKKGHYLWPSLSTVQNLLPPPLAL